VLSDQCVQVLCMCWFVFDCCPCFQPFVHQIILIRNVCFFLSFTAVFVCRYVAGLFMLFAASRVTHDIVL